DTKYGIHTICCVGTKRLGQRGQILKNYAANIAMELNPKFGGRNHVIHENKLGIIKEDKRMVVGIDDGTHPSPGSLKDTPSVSVMVASTNKFLTQWPTILTAQNGKRRKSGTLVKCLRPGLISGRL
ncbi:hypothetical protein DM02DRAFT_685938, partial [Periconia macrospinosa]